MIDIMKQEEMFLLISGLLKRKMTVYAIGGTAMMFHGFKNATKDIDIVFFSEDDRLEFKRALEEVGYKGYDSVQVYGRKENQPIMLSRGSQKEERFDLFSRDVIRFVFSENMKKRATKTIEIGKNIVLKIADPHDIIIMKCATDRMKDKEDALSIIDKHGVDWDIVIDEAQNQTGLGNKRALFDLAEFVDDLIKMKAKISKKVLEKLIKTMEDQ
ncbi:hypothetical protein JXB27_02335 [Candidatus Woesearchaeota archaeon]|nr:hypothetical protein [Candidatus Woesearchaeota archaeon]